MFERVTRQLELGIMLLADIPGLRGSDSKTAKEMIINVLKDSSLLPPEGQYEIQIKNISERGT